MPSGGAGVPAAESLCVAGRAACACIGGGVLACMCVWEGDRERRHTLRALRLARRHDADLWAARSKLEQAAAAVPLCAWLSKWPVRCNPLSGRWHGTQGID